MPDALLLTCEHATAWVPSAYRRLFASTVARKALASHRGLDIGALTVARELARACGAPLVCGRITRLLVDLNRSLSHQRLFSEYSRVLSTSERQRLIVDYYSPYRAEVTSRVAALLTRASRVVHVSVHSFTPSLDGAKRRADVGLLYDPARPGELRVARHWQRQLAESRRLRVRRNYPYRGASDGLTSALRAEFRQGRYVGLELELNQRFFIGQQSRRRVELSERLSETLARVLA